MKPDSKVALLRNKGCQLVEDGAKFMNCLTLHFEELLLCSACNCLVKEPTVAVVVAAGVAVSAADSLYQSASWKKKTRNKVLAVH